MLSRAIAELGIYPAVDPLDSTSRIMDPNVIGAEHYNTARGVQKILQVIAPLFPPKLQCKWTLTVLLHFKGLQIFTRYYRHLGYG